MATNKHEIEQINRTIVADVKLHYYPKMKASDRAVVQRSGDAYRIFMDQWDMSNIYVLEESKLLLLNRGNRVLGIVTLSKGGIGGTVVDPRIVFRYALLSGATSLVLAHNHPSCNFKPSKADLDVTSKIKQAGQFHDIQLMDHLIVSPEGYLSMADEGLL